MLQTSKKSVVNAQNQQQQPPQQQYFQHITPAQKHAMVETVRRKWTAEQLQTTANPAVSNMTNPPVVSVSLEKSQKMHLSKRRNHTRPSPLNEIDEVNTLSLIVCSLIL